MDTNFMIAWISEREGFWDQNQNQDEGGREGLMYVCMFRKRVRGFAVF